MCIRDRRSPLSLCAEEPTPKQLPSRVLPNRLAIFLPHAGPLYLAHLRKQRRGSKHPWYLWQPSPQLNAHCRFLRDEFPKISNIHAVFCRETPNMPNCTRPAHFVQDKSEQAPPSTPVDRRAEGNFKHQPVGSSLKKGKRKAAPTLQQIAPSYRRMRFDAT